MKHTMKRLLAVILCVALCAGLYVPALAADANTISLSLSNPTVVSSGEAQTVTLNIVTSEPVSIDSLQYRVVLPTGFTADEPVLPAETTNPAQKGWSNNFLTWTWFGDAGTNVDGLTNLGAITINIPANIAAGSYQIQVTEFDATANNATYWAEQATYTTTLTVVGSGSYSAAITATPGEVEVEESVTATVAVSGDPFASAQFTVTYDAAKLQYTGITGLGERGQVNTATPGIIKVVDTGDTKAGNTYIIAFKAIADGTATIGLSNDAAFSTKADAAASDLTTATVNPASATVTIKKAPHDVTLPGEWFTGSNKAEDGEPYTFAASKWDNYDYGTVTYVMGTAAAQTVTPDANGNYTIGNVTDDLVISMAADPTPKSYSVTIDGETESNDGNQATYNTPYSFTLKEDKEADTEEGYTYKLISVTINGEAYGEYTKSDRTYTIPGTAITGPIVITIEKETVEADQFTVDVTGSGAGHATVAKSPVDKNESASITIAKDSAYTYTVADVTANVVFTVTKTLKVDSATATPYVTVQGSQMWLVKIGTEKLGDKVYTYAGNNMFWSAKYNAYCWLVISGTTPAITTAEFDLVAGTAVDVDYGKDVNKTGKVDANDAQFVYNMYKTEYSGFTADVTVEKYLRADVSGEGGNPDGTINVSDALAIISSLLGN